MSRRRRFDFEEARRRYEAGESTPSIARDVGVSATAVRMALKRMGVTMRPGNRDTSGFVAANAAKKTATHCKRNHEYTPENTYFNQLGGRGCKTCVREQQNARRAAQRAAGYKRRSYPAKPVEAHEVKCPSCGTTRIARFPGARCGSCAVTAAQGFRGRDCLCSYCGKQFRVGNSKLKKGMGQFCSMSCRIQGGGYKEMGRKLSLARGGDGNPSYKHGRRVDIQIPGWKLNNKGERHCRNCGSRQRVELHHAIPRSKARHVRADLRNGIPLCFDCHRGWHAKKVVLYRDLFTEDEWAFISSVELTGELIGPWLDKHYPPRPAAEVAA